MKLKADDRVKMRKKANAVGEEIANHILKGEWKRSKKECKDDIDWN